MARMPVVKEEWCELAEASSYNSRKLAALLGYSTRQLQREVKRQFGQTPQNLLDESRLRIAGQMLLLKRPVKVVAIELGYKQTSHFCRQFKVWYGATPSQFIAWNGSRRFAMANYLNSYGRLHDFSSGKPILS